MSAYPEDSSYGTCDDCGGGAYTCWHGDQICRKCHERRVNFIARNRWARKNVLSYFADNAPDFYTPEQLAAWEAKGPERAQKRKIIKANIAAYKRGEFPPNESLLKGVEP